MAAWTEPRTKSQRRKLNRDEVIEILERNAGLYKDEGNFVPYLVELAVYLLEYEYQWPEGGPPSEPGRSESRQSPRAGMVHLGEHKTIVSKLTPKAYRQKRRQCRFCGAFLGDEIQCPSCRGINR